VAVTHAPAAVALVGFMGAGKSAVGRELAAALGIRFVDSDDLIVAQAGPIDAFFSARGEAAFRALEAEIVTAACAEALERPCVLALGGGAVLSGEVRAALSRFTHVVWLSASAGVLWERVTSLGQAERPLATDEASFGALLAGRESLYREVATQTVDVDARRPRDIAAEIAAALSGAAGDVRGRAGGGAG
jgi:shikimate kinase